MHFYDAFHTRSDEPAVKGIIGMYGFNICLVVVLSLSCRCLALVWKHHTTWCERHHRNAQVQHLSCRCLVVVLLWCENTITLYESGLIANNQHGRTWSTISCIIHFTRLKISRTFLLMNCLRHRQLWPSVCLKKAGYSVDNSGLL